MIVGFGKYSDYLNKIRNIEKSLLKESEMGAYQGLNAMQRMRKSVVWRA